MGTGAEIVPIRVLEVFHGMDCGGAENMIMNLYRRMDRSRVQMDFLVHTGKKCFFDDEIRSLGGNVYAVPYYNVANTVRYRRAVEAFFNSHPEYRVVHGHVGSCAHIYLKVAKRHGCFTILHSHNIRPELSAKSVLFRLFTYKARRLADYCMGCGKEAGEYLFGSKITSDPGRYSILPNAIDTAKFGYDVEARRSVREEFGMGDNPLLGNVGRLTYQKNPEFLLEIMKEISVKEPGAKLLLAGDGELKGFIEKKISDLGMEGKVILTGVRNDVARLLQGMDCMIFPSLYEGVPVALVEAQASGLPCVVSDRVPEEVAFTDLVERLSLEESAGIWADAVLKACSRPDRRSYGEETRKAGYDIGSTAEWLMGFYERAARRKRK